MAHINLLPWREERRKERQQEFLVYMLFAAALAGLVVFFVHVQIEGRIEYQQARNKFLENEIRIIDKRIAEIRELEKTKKALLERMKIIEELQTSRPGVVHLFDELVKTLPDGLYLKSLKQKGNKLYIEGEAESNARVSAYMRNLEASPWFKDPSLEIVKSDSGGGKGKKGARNPTVPTKQFKLTVTITSPSDEKKKED
ncbi:MAG TPA: pilus assembly protein PilN [Chromatiales bacterium]|nr:pilus assembly protein PilN [Chromatiales bacterium]